MTGSQTQLSCDSNTLTATWLTDRTFSSQVSAVPSDLYRQLTARLQEADTKLHSFQIVVINNSPP